MNRFIVACLLSLVLIIPGLARAQNGSPFYISGAGAFSLVQDSEIGSKDAPTDATLRSADTKLELDSGLGLSAAVGVVLKKRFRIEFEYGYKNADATAISLNTPAGANVQFPVAGDLSIHAFMLNGAFDFRNKSRFTPFLGVGIGLAAVDFDNPTFTTSGVTIPASSNSNNVFAYQLFGGVGYWISSQVVAFLGYKYFATADPEFTLTRATIDAHNFELGIRYYFSRP